MAQGLRSLVGTLLAMGMVALVHPRAWAAGGQTADTSRPAFTTSATFHLHPQAERASFDLRRPSLRALYEAISQAYGIRLLRDRDLGEEPLVGGFRLQDATLEQALEAAGSISKTFVAPVDEHTGIVAADTPQKRSEYERQILDSFHMDPQSTPQQLTEVVTALHSLLDLSRVAPDARSYQIAVRGRTRQVEAAEQFVQTLQKEPGEVLLEAEIWELDSRRARELGVLPPQVFQLFHLGDSAPSPADSVLSFGQGRTLYGLRLPGASARLEFSSSVVRSYDKFQLRASQAQPASLLVGERFPLVTVAVSSSLSPQTEETPQSSVFAPGLFPTIQYEDLGVGLDATPYLHAGSELTLQLDLSIRNLGAQELNGLPTITNRQVTGQIRLRDGEGYLLSGLLRHGEQATRSGFPWLSRLPLIGRLFGSRGKQKDETEWLVLIRPHILRPAPAEEIASRAIFFGKELTGLPAIPMPQPIPPIQPGAPGGAQPQPGVPTPEGFPPGIAFPPTPAQPGTAQPEPLVPGAPVPTQLPPGVFPQTVLPQ